MGTIPTPYLTIDLDIVARNARTIVRLCREHGIEVTGVTKAVCGEPAIARVMLQEGTVSIADSRFQNIRRMKAAGIETAFMLLRVPPLSRIEETLATAALSLNSELAVLEALSVASLRSGRVHEVMLMVDLGDLREGIWPDDLAAFARKAASLPGLRIVGLGTNLACLAGVVPTVQNMQQLSALADAVEQGIGSPLRWVSGINSSGLELIGSGRLPGRINHARIGEAILLGRETTQRRAWPGTQQDAFRLYAEVLELKKKPSLPLGERGQDAFGRHPLFEDRGECWRALLNLGHEDVEVDGLAPLDPRFRIMGATSGYLVLDVTAGADDVRVGDTLGFSIDYSALLATMSSAYVTKHFLREGAVQDTG